MHMIKNMQINNYIKINFEVFSIQSYMKSMY